MVKPKSVKKRTPKKVIEPSNSKELLIQAAKSLFAAEGFDRVSTRDIAKKAGVNISLISYHFEGKEGLLRACLEEISTAGLETVERVLKKPESAEEFKTRLQIFIEEFIRVHMKFEETSRMLMREVSNGLPNPTVSGHCKTRFVPIYEKLLDFLNYSQKQKYIPATFDVEVTSLIMLGTIQHALLTDPLRKQILGREPLLVPGQIEKTCRQLSHQLLNGLLTR